MRIINETSLIQIKDVSKTFGMRLVLNNINLEIDRGEIIVIIGPSGGGKSMLLRSLVTLEEIDSGEIIVDGNCLVSYRNGRTEYASGELLRTIKSKFGMVFQNFPLFPHMTVLENITLSPIQVLKLTKERALYEAKELLKKVDLENYCNTYPYELSGGQKQRAAIARVLAVKPEIVLFDEPTSALDPELASSVLKVIKSLILEENRTMIIVTHNIKFAEDVADRIIFMENGKILEESRCEEFFSYPKSVRLKKFLSHA